MCNSNFFGASALKDDTLISDPSEIKRRAVEYFE